VVCILASGNALADPAPEPTAQQVAEHPLTIAKRLRKARQFEEAEAVIDPWLAFLEQSGQSEIGLGAALRERGFLSVDQQRYDEGLAFIERSLEIRRRVYGSRHVRVGNALADYALALNRAGRIEAANEVVDESMSIQREQVDIPVAKIADRLGTVGVIRKAQGRLQEARDALEEAIAILDGETDRDPFQLAATLNNLAMTAWQQGDKNVALPTTARALEIFRDELDPRHPRIVPLLTNLAHLASSMDRFDEANTWLDEAESVLDDTVGRDHPESLSIDGRRAALAMAQGQVDHAVSLWRSVVERSTALLGAQHPETLGEFESLAQALIKANRNVEAVDLLETTLASREAVHGRDGIQVAATLGGLADAYVAVGALTKAEHSSRRAIQILESAGRRGGKERLDLADVLLDRGDSVEARRIVEDELAWRLERYGPEHIETAIAYKEHADLLKNLGDGVGALRSAQRALEATEASLGPDSPRRAFPLISIATSLEMLGRIDEADPAFREAVALTQRHGNRVDRMGVLNNLGMFLRRAGRHEEALVPLRESLEIREGTPGVSPVRVASGRSALGLTYLEMGRVGEAEALLGQAVQALEQNLGPHSARTLAAQTYWARALWKTGAEEKARGAASEVFDRAVQVAGTAGAALSEREALAALQRSRDALEVVLTTHDERDYDTRAYAAVLATKGAVSRRILARNAMLSAADPETAALGKDLTALRRQAAHLVMIPGDDPQRRSDELEDLGSRIDGLERQIAIRNGVPRGNPMPSVDEICAALPSDSTLVDWTRHAMREGRDEVFHYTAFVLSEAECRVQRIALGPAQPIDDAIAAWRARLASTMAANRIDSVGREVTRRVWDPVAPFVESRAVLAPDGPLAEIPWGALPLAESKYLIEEVELTLLQSAAEVLTPPATSRGKGALVVGGVDYGEAENEESATRNGCAHEGWSPLPATAAEATAVAALLAGQAKVLEGAEATEEAVLSNMTGKRVVHLATHGFFATGACRAAISGTAAGAVVGYHPLALSGVVLAGASDPPEGVEDGILTALEVASVDLRGTEIVVLSACQTGLGEMLDGEGVLGLRRAFRTAGARHLVLSLWSVPDVATGELMRDFYKALRRRRTATAPEALRAAQLQALERARETGDSAPRDWAAFIATGIPRR